MTGTRARKRESYSHNLGSHAGHTHKANSTLVRESRMLGLQRASGRRLRDPRATAARVHGYSGEQTSNPPVPNPHPPPIGSVKKQPENQSKRAERETPHKNRCNTRLILWKSPPLSRDPRNPRRTTSTTTSAACTRRSSGRRRRSEMCVLGLEALWRIHPKENEERRRQGVRRWGALEGVLRIIRRSLDSRRPGQVLGRGCNGTLRGRAF